ncbi:MAG: M23 family metallopeptidase [Bacteroidales bacterium]|nr:M23 family metallopeptidase [Bacteroidales bacterium]MCM1415028.1 M23 family metallopeptidase [bacterium]MCM1422882.1 M23 family metallopeptidase [bacterium]
MRIAYIKVAAFACIVAAFFLPQRQSLESTGDNYFTVYLNGVQVGVMGDAEAADDCLIAARKQLAAESDEMVLAESDLTWEGEEVLWGQIDDRSVIISNMLSALRGSVKETLNRSYTVKINEYTVNLASTEEVLALLQASLKKYDSGRHYYADLVLDSSRELSVLTTQIYSTDELRETEAEETMTSAGINAALDEIFSDIEPTSEKDFEDYELGLLDLKFGDTVEVVESYLQDYELTPLATAIEEVTKDQEKEQIYEVVAGDTLSQIAEKNEIPLDRLIAMNETIEDENSLIRVGDELIVTVPEPELSVERTEQMYYEEDYEAEIIYVDNDDWYTNQTQTLQEPSAGHRKVVADVSYRNSEEVSREILKEEITYAAVPKIVERGTKIPPTYLKPISGGRLSSGFGRRKAPTRGASTYHKGVDWATPVGTAVMASCTGTVAKAGWGSGYGYVVYINHSDGRQTRYGHLSKVLVKQGQTVTQGQKIALSGNTGVSTGPHVHFEILINGTQVNPFDYLN